MISASFFVQKLIQTCKKYQDEIVLFAAGFFMLFFIKNVIGLEKHYLIAIPFIFITAFFMLFVPKLFLFCFIGSFFFDFNLFVQNSGYGYIAFNLQDVLCLIFIVGYWGKYLINGNEKRNPPPFNGFYKTTITQKFIWLLFVLAIISSLLNFQTFSMFDSMRSISYLFHFLELLAIFSLILMKTTYQERDWFIGIIIVFSLGELLVVGYQYFLGWLHGTYAYKFRDISGLFVHHSQIGNMMTISISCAMYKMLAAKTVRNKIFYLILSLLFCWAIICSGSRGNLLGVMCAIGIMILTQIKLSKTFFLFLLGVLLISTGLVLFSPILQLVNITLNSPVSGVDQSSYNRFFIWKGAWEQFVKAPFITKLFGIGIGNFTNLHYSFLLESGKKATSGAHNNFLHVLTETGIIGASIFIGFFLSIIATLWKKGKEDSLAYCYIWVTIALLISGFSQETFWFQPSFGNFWLYYMLGLGLALIKKPTQLAARE